MPEKYLDSPHQLGEVTRNIGTVLLTNAHEFSKNHAFAERRNGQYKYWTWQQLAADAYRVANYYQTNGLVSGDKIGFVSANGYWRFVCEIACMSCGLVSVPIFPNYPDTIIRDLLNFAEIKFLIVGSDQLASKLKDGCWQKTLVIGDKDWQLAEVSEAEQKNLQNKFAGIESTALAMIMFTSGTSGRPKGVMLSHHNILSQQKALDLLWRPEKGMRFLCYLPWHHSFGGLFERFSAFCSGGCLAIDDSWGKDINRLFMNYREIKPHVYFGVPKVYQEIVARVLSSRDLENCFFHTDLKFIFTAAAPLPLSASDVFKAKGIPIVEGWGLTETSPCCTLTELNLDRKPGVVGWPIPGVQIRLDASGEILVRGPNVMSGYYNSPKLTQEVLESNGWFHTGDLGEITEDGVKILSRKDRMFKLSNGEKVFPGGIEERIKTRCGFIKHAYVFGSGKTRASILIFPNYEMFCVKNDSDLTDSTCALPSSESLLCTCLGSCVSEINSSIKSDIERVDRIVIVPHELTIENHELTPSFKLIPSVIEERYKEYMQDESPQDALIFRLRAK
ncbi:MAG: hypothetical protein A2Z20_09750 [Bdellovibrionales bacterium RBG_16_40_8]|nr:MAG: hypothetical protein A2Z20_09750 [Bdellovibrionales bacterium RBG_16_40_8]